MKSRRAEAEATFNYRETRKREWWTAGPSRSDTHQKLDRDTSISLAREKIPRGWNRKEKRTKHYNNRVSSYMFDVDPLSRFSVFFLFSRIVVLPSF